MKIRLDKIGEWKFVGRNREGNGESGSAQIEERWCAGRKKKKNRYSWVWGKKIRFFFFVNF